MRRRNTNRVLMQRLQRMHIPRSLRRRVYEYTRFAWERYRGKDTNALFAGESSEIPLSRSLRTEMALLAHAPIISSKSMFINPLYFWARSQLTNYVSNCINRMPFISRLRRWFYCQNQYGPSRGALQPWRRYISLPWHLIEDVLS